MKKLISIMMAAIILISSISIGNITAFAKDTKEAIKTKTVSCDDTYEISFKLDKDSVVYITFEVIIDDELIGNYYYDKLDGTNGIGVGLYAGTTWDDDFDFIDYCKFTIDKGYYDGYFWYCSDEMLPEGHYTLEIEGLKNNIVSEAMKCKCSIYAYSGYAKKAKLSSKASVEVGDYKEISLKNLSPKDSISNAKWSVSDKKIAKIYFTAKDSVWIKGIKKGSCTLKVKLQNGKTYKCKVTVKKASPQLNYASIELPFGDSKTLKVKNTSKKVVWKSSNKKIATVNSKGKVTAKKTGSCTITAKCGKKTYKCKVKVYKMWPDFVAKATDYYTRDNYFTVKFKNYGSKAVTILSDGAYCMDVDYKSYDRDLYLSKNKSVKIKPGEIKTVKFRVKGDTTWPDYTDFTIRYYFKYNGSKYLGSVWYEDSAFKRNDKWYNTYYYESDMVKFLGYDYI